MADIDLSIGYNDGNAEQVVDKLTVAEEKHEQAVKRNQWAIEKAAKAEEKLFQTRHKAIREHAKELDRLDKSAHQAGGGMTVFHSSMGKALALAGGWTAIAATVGKLEDRLLAVADANKKIAQSMIPLAQLYGANGLDRRMIATGAEFGMRPELSAALGVTIPAGLGAGVEDFRTGGRLAQMGVAPERAGDVIVAGISRGVGSERAADLTLVGAGESKLTANEFSRVIPASAQFSRMEEGLAAAAAISLSGVNAERIPELTKSAGKALSNEQSSFAKKYGLGGLSESDKIAKLREFAERSGDVGKFASLPNLISAGLGEQEAESVGMLIRNAGAFEATERKLTGTVPGELKRTIARIRRQRPEIAAVWDVQRSEAELAANRYMGVERDPATEFDIRSRAQGLLLRRRAPKMSPLLTDTETGRANFFGRLATDVPFFDAEDYNKVSSTDKVTQARRRSKGLDPLNSPSGLEALRIETRYLNQDTNSALLQDLASALRENTAATRENSDATGGGDAGYSAPPPRRNTGGERN